VQLHNPHLLKNKNSYYANLPEELSVLVAGRRRNCEGKKRVSFKIVDAVNDAFFFSASCSL